MTHDSDKNGGGSDDYIFEHTPEERNTVIDTLPPPTEPPGQETNDE